MYSMVVCSMMPGGGLGLVTAISYEEWALEKEQDNAAPLFELRTNIERQYVSLNPTAPPLATHALKDDEGYLLPDTLLVGDVLAEGKEVRVVLQKELRKANEADLNQVLPRWHYFQTYTLLTLSASIKRVLREKSHRVGMSSLTVLIQLLTAMDEATVLGASNLLRMVLVDDPGALTEVDMGKWICTLGMHTENATIKEDCASILSSLVKHPTTKPGIIKHGACATLLHLSRSTNPKIRSAATSGLIQVSSKYYGQNPQKAGKALMGNAMHEKSLKASPLSLDDAISALEADEILQVKHAALETLLREVGDEPLRNMLLVDGVRIFRALKRVVATSPPCANLVAGFISELVSYEDESEVVYRHGGFELVVEINSMEQNNGEEKDGGKQEYLEAMCNSVFGPPLSLLVQCLSESPYASTRVILASTLLSRAKNDDTNELRKYIPPLLTGANQAFHKELELLAQTLSLLSVKEVNKSMLLRYGAHNMFISFLSVSNTQSTLELERIGSKALANLSSSSEANRSIVIQAMHASDIPHMETISDSIVAMYLEMAFSV